MKKSSLVLVIPLLFIAASPSFAVVNNIPTIRQEIKDKKAEIKNERLEIKETRTSLNEQRKETGTQNRLLRAQATMKRLRQGIVSRYENVLKQKTNIEARIAKIEAMVVPTPKTKRDLTAAKAKLATFDTSKYVTDLASFDAKSAEVLASTTPLKLTPELKAIAKTLDSDVKAMRTTLADTLRLMIKAR